MRPNLRPAATTAPVKTRPPSAWAPLREPVFRAIWTASVVSNLGTWMHDVAASWLMASLSHSALVIALMQTATTAPVFLLALPAGTAADLMDRRRWLLFSQTWMLLAAGALAVLTGYHLIAPWSLLALTFALGIGNALNAPAWQSIVPDLVGRENLHQGIALNGMSNNLARAVGPAIGGLIVAASGAQAVFLLNALSFIAVIIALWRWRGVPTPAAKGREPFVTGMRAAMRYASHSREVTRVLVRAIAFLVFASVFWSLLPALGRNELNLDALSYGTLYGAVGSGAVLAAAFRPRLHSRFGNEGLLGVAVCVFAAAVAMLAWVRNLQVLAVLLLLTGGAWLTFMASLNASAQVTLPAWVRARGMAVYIVVTQGCLALGSAFWGWIAEHAGLSLAYVTAALGMVLGWLVTRRLKLSHGGAAGDLEPTHHWPFPERADGRELPEKAAVMVTIEYLIAPEDRQKFLEVMHEIKLWRRRDGAQRWRLFYDVEESERYIELYTVASWGDHVRHHDRATPRDRRLEERVLALHRGDGPPRLVHMLEERP